MAEPPRPPRHWTVDEARAELPRVRALVELIVETAKTAALVPTNGRRGPAVQEAEAALDQLNEDGIVLRDPESGLIDFLALGPDGEEYCLCWRLGEDDLAWWHPLDTGFAGRRPLPRDVP
jgi:hypothetical protein